jgi:hypothetical protein
MVNIEKLCLSFSELKFDKNGKNCVSDLKTMKMEYGSVQNVKVV